MARRARRKGMQRLQEEAENDDEDEADESEHKPEEEEEQEAEGGEEEEVPRLEPDLEQTTRTHAHRPGARPASMELEAGPRTITSHRLKLDHAVPHHHHFDFD